MTCLCDNCASKVDGAVAVDQEEYAWLTSCAEKEVNLRDAAGRIVDMAREPDFRPSDEFRMWVKRLEVELTRKAA